MISKQVHFFLRERRNTFCKSGKEWALYVQFVGHDVWTIMTWENKPSGETVKGTKDVVMRSFEFYHRHLYIPAFNIESVDLTEAA